MRTALRILALRVRLAYLYALLAGLLILRAARVVALLAVVAAHLAWGWISRPTSPHQTPLSRTTADFVGHADLTPRGQEWVVAMHVGAREILWIGGAALVGLIALLGLSVLRDVLRDLRRDRARWRSSERRDGEQGR